MRRFLAVLVLAVLAAGCSSGADDGGPAAAPSATTQAPAATQAAKVEPPYVLLGASFGGLIAHIYAASYPKEVTGMVLLDAAFPDEVDLERYSPSVLEKVESDHYMEAAVPDRIVQELEQVIATS